MAESKINNYSLYTDVLSKFTFAIPYEAGPTSITQVGDHLLIINLLFTTPSTVSSDYIVASTNSYDIKRTFTPIYEAYSGNIVGLLNMTNGAIRMASDQWQPSKRVLVHAVVNF